MNVAYRRILRHGDGGRSTKLLGFPTNAARHDRDYLAMSLMVALRFRRGNYGILTYKQDANGRDIGSLRWVPEGQVWKICLWQEELKYDGSSALPPNGSPLIIEIDPQDRRLYSAIDRWLKGGGCSRRLLDGDSCGP